MKQGKSYFTVILWILLAAITAYFGYHVISSLYAPLMTTTVTPYEAGAGYYASGFVVREEELLYSQYGTTVLSCAEGAHVAANDTVATGYRSEDARPGRRAWTSCPARSSSFSTRGAPSPASTIRLRSTRTSRMRLRS